jgi:hypothetical protein
MDFPKFAIIGSRAAKAVPTEDGGLDVLAYDPEKDTFQRDMYFADKFFEPSSSTEFVTEERFLQYVSQQRRAAKAKSLKKKHEKAKP